MYKRIRNVQIRYKQKYRNYKTSTDILNYDLFCDLVRYSEKYSRYAIFCLLARPARKSSETARDAIAFCYCLLMLSLRFARFIFCVSHVLTESY